MPLGFGAPSISRSLPYRLPFSLKSTLTNLPSPKLLGTVLPRPLGIPGRWNLLATHLSCTLRLSEVPGSLDLWEPTLSWLLSILFSGLLLLSSHSLPASFTGTFSLHDVSASQCLHHSSESSSVRYLAHFHGFKIHSSVQSMNPRSVPPISPFQWVSVLQPYSVALWSAQANMMENGYVFFPNIIIPTHSGSLSASLLNGSCWVFISVLHISCD